MHDSVCPDHFFPPNRLKTLHVCHLNACAAALFILFSFFFVVVGAIVFFLFHYLLACVYFEWNRKMECHVKWLQDMYFLFEFKEFVFCNIYTRLFQFLMMNPKFSLISFLLRSVFICSAVKKEKSRKKKQQQRTNNEWTHNKKRKIKSVLCESHNYYYILSYCSWSCSLSIFFPIYSWLLFFFLSFFSNKSFIFVLFVCFFLFQIVHEQIILLYTSLLTVV